MKLRCIIIDDEYLARKRLFNLLSGFNEIVIIAQCRNGAEAIEKIHLKEPDLIFLDIQMPDMDGFTVLSKINLNPYVIFTTAFDKFAIKAFEINAVDYLLKPFDEDRISIAVQRILSLKQKELESDLESKIKNMMRSYEAQSSSYLSSFTIRIKGRDITIYIDDVIYIKSEGNYVQLITTEKDYLYRTTMNSLNNSLDSNQFLRIHRSFTLNKKYIQSCQYISNNEYKFSMKNHKNLTSARSYSSVISEYLDHQ